MSIPRVLLAPTHRTGLGDAVAAAVAEIASARGDTVRYHHLGPLSPSLCWDRWEGTVFLDPALYSDDSLLALYDVATRGASLSLLSSTCGVLDRQDGAAWQPVDLAGLLDCPVVVLIDCRGWGTGIRLLVTGLKSHLTGVNFAGVILSGVRDRDHFVLLREVFAGEGVSIVGCLFEGDGPGWETEAPGAWGLPLEITTLDAISRQIDVDGLVSLAGQRGFLLVQNRLVDRGEGGPVIGVAGGKGFTPWSRDSIEILRAAGAQVRRVDLLEHTELPTGASGLVLAGTLWPGALAEIAMNTSLLGAIRDQIEEGLPTLALGGGMLILMDKVQDSLGRQSELAGVIAAEGEVLWDLEEPAYVRMIAGKDSLLFAKGERVTGWVLTDVEIRGAAGAWDSPLLVVDNEGSGGRSTQTSGSKPEGMASGSMFCSRVLVHLAAGAAMASRFVGECAAYAVRREGSPSSQ